MNCRKCNRRPCQCKISTTTTNCSTGYCAPTVVPPTICAPGSNRPTPPKITIEDLLKLIESKCDKEICQLLHYEIGLLYLLLELERPDTVPPGTNPPGNGGGGVIVPPVHHKKFQLIANMVDTLHGGKLKDKYPSAQLLKDELLSLWQCMYNKQQHHGEWSTNFTYRDVIQFGDDKKCLTDGGKDYAPDKLKVITPVDVGSTVFNTIDGKRCLFESLVDNNTTEPTKLSVLRGQWMNYCDLKKVIDCVLPRVELTDCKDACDDPNKDGVIEGRPLCECVICTVVDTNTVDLTKTKLPKSKDNPLGQGNSIKADVKIDKTVAGNMITSGPNGLSVVVPPNDGLPAGAVTFIKSILGTDDISFNESNADSTVPGAGNFPTSDVYHTGIAKKVFKVADYPYLATTGKKIVLSMSGSFAYYILADKKGPAHSVYPYSVAFVLLRGTSRLMNSGGDGYSLSTSGDWGCVADNGSATIVTNGKDLELDFRYEISAGHSPGYTKGDSIHVDMGSVTLMFSADGS